MIARHLRFLVCLLILEFVLSADAQNVSYDGLDIVFLVDQSDSMSGTPGIQIPASDPFNLRFEAVQYALDTLGEYRLNIAPEVDIQFAVVNFGDDAEVGLDWTIVAENADAALWEQNRIALLDALSVESFLETHNPFDNLGNTDFDAAYRTAQSLFSQLPAAENRLRVIVMLTDGQPCAPDLFDCETEYNLAVQFMEGVVEFTAGEFDSDQYQLYALVLDVRGQLWDNWSPFWEQITRDPNHTSRLESSQQIGPRFFEILCQVTEGIRSLETASLCGETLLEGVNEIIVPHFQKSMRVSIFKSNRSPGVISVLQPDGTPLLDTQIKVENRDRPIEVWTIDTPQSGTWTFTIASNQDRIDVVLDFLPFEVSVNLNSQAVRRFTETPISLQVTDSDGSITPQYPPPYDLKVAALLTQPDGSEREVQLDLVGDAYISSFFAEQAGVYKVRVIGRSQMIDGSSFVVFDEPSAAIFTVTDVNFTVEAPQDTYLVDESLTLPITLNYTDGQPVDLPNLNIEAELIGINGIAPLTLTDVDHDGLYSLAMLMVRPGSARLRLTASAQPDPAQARVVIAQLETAVFDILPSRPVSLHLISPDIPFSHNAQLGIPPFSASPLNIVFEARLDEDNSLFDIFALTNAPDNSVFTVTVMKDGQMWASPSVSQGEQAGVYQFSLNQPQPGNYIITIRANAQFQDRFVFKQSDSQLVLTGDVRTHPNITFFTTIAIVLVILLALFVSVRILLNLRRRKHPARGKLSLVVTDSSGDSRQVWQRNLPHMNYIVYGKRQLKGTKLTKLIVECSSDDHSKEGYVYVTAYIKKFACLKRELMRPGSSTLMEDPTISDDYARDRYRLWKDVENYDVSGSTW